ncbi:Beta-mannanase [Frankia sp. AiPs1]|uniref:glycoside hydrolase family 26 protein n=1 Tax=Frankia sp. AiPa1 TaxID=573492 RepID=UPI00202AE0D6|nr:glycosyl hydrolase [Frankia sp. AiPa1]MCL9762232.1 cellulase family glycosylhydrolase [Frankia sp. AiPa1]
MTSACGVPRARVRAVRRAMILAVALVAAGLSACSHSSSPGPTPPRPAGVHWVSGSNGNYPSEVNAWGTFTGRKVGLAIVFTDRRTWSGLVSDDWPTSAFTKDKFPGELSIAQPLYPEGGNEAACAAGDYDRYWSQFGTTLTKYGRADAYVRLGWEFNGGYMYWHVRDVEAWKTCFRRTVTAIRSTDPTVKIDWNMNAHNDTLPGGKQSVWDAYPGDKYVDVVSIDSYDHYPASLTEATWNKQCHMQSGLCTVIQFAKDHGKKFAVPEWGVVRSTGGGGDNPFYVSKMYQTFAANAQDLAYEAYYRTSEAGNVLSSLSNPDLNPKASKRYLRLFGGTSTTTS